MSGKDSVALVQLVRDRLRPLHRHLQLVHAEIVVTTAALERQNVDVDRDVARVLKHCVGARLHGQIEGAAEVIASLERLLTAQPAGRGPPAKGAGPGRRQERRSARGTPRSRQSKS
ncbi:MAG TPA: hypothetical protein VF329_05670 [Gammaproteobacteria bacterium]